jgi:hypothetical protein
LQSPRICDHLATAPHLRSPCNRPAFAITLQSLRICDRLPQIYDFFVFFLTRIFTTISRLTETQLSSMLREIRMETNGGDADKIAEIEQRYKVTDKSIARALVASVKWVIEDPVRKQANKEAESAFIGR